jgi:2-C-methyl-D-erythritol 4-phosphate cytidylyltransferase
MAELPAAVAVLVVAGRLPIEAMIQGRTAFERALSALSAAPGVREVIVAPQVEIGEEVRAAHACPSTWCSPQASRLPAIRSALDAAGPSSSVLVHDADQPLVTPRCLSEVLVGTADHPAVAGGAAVKAAFKRVVNGVIEETVPRHRLVRLVGPRAFRRDVLLQVLLRADAERWLCHDEVRAARLAGVPVAIHRMTDINIRVTDALSSDLAGRHAIGL